MNSDDSMTTNGEFLFYHKNGQGLYKLNNFSKSNSCIDLIERNADFSWEAGHSMCFFNEKLYVRTPGENEKPFMIIDPNTLKEEEKFEPELEKEEPNMLWTEKKDEKTGRHLKDSPLFTDGKYFYLVSQKHMVKDKDAPEDEEQHDEPPALVVEWFDPSTNSFKFVNSTTLKRSNNEDNFSKTDDEGVNS